MLQVIFRDSSAFIMFPRPVLWINIAGFPPAIYAPAQMPMPFSSLVSGISKKLLDISGRRFLIRSHGSVATMSISFCCSISMTDSSGDPISTHRSHSPSSNSNNPAPAPRYLSGWIRSSSGTSGFFALAIGCIFVRL